MDQDGKGQGQGKDDKSDQTGIYCTVVWARKGKYEDKEWT